MMVSSSAVVVAVAAASCSFFGSSAMVEIVTIEGGTIVDVQWVAFYAAYCESISNLQRAGGSAEFVVESALACLMMLLVASLVLNGCRTGNPKCSYLCKLRS